ncbi:MAG TPA: hypothetical protein VIW70_17375 [Rubrivivax sp.]
MTESQRISSVLETMRRERAHSVLVLDECGVFGAVATLEDLIEEIAGEIAADRINGLAAMPGRCRFGTAPTRENLPFKICRSSDGVATLGCHFNTSPTTGRMASTRSHAHASSHLLRGNRHRTCRRVL